MTAVVIGSIALAAGAGATAMATAVDGDDGDTEAVVTTGAARALSEAASVGAPAQAVPLRISRAIEQRESPIAPPVERRDSAVMAIGTSRIDTAGVAGTRHQTVEVTRHNGVIVEETVVSTLDVPPLPAVVVIGTNTSEAATKDWGALAWCESGGNPSIVSSSGRYHGLYQFDVSTWRSVGGEGLPSLASPDEQTERAMALYEERGAAPWPTCGRHL